MKATHPALEKVGSHSISARNGWDTDNEECFPVVSLDWRGERLRVQFHARRYVASVWYEAEQTSRDEWTDWMVSGGGSAARLEHEDWQFPVSLTATASSRARESATPLILEWLKNGRTQAADGTSYDESRQHAFRWYFIGELRDTRGSLGRFRHAWDKHAVELEPRERDRLEEAARHLEKFLELTSS